MRKRRFRAAIVMLAGLAGCGGGNQETTVQFPDVSKLPPPAAPSKADFKAESVQGSLSKGDPSQYTRSNK